MRKFVALFILALFFGAAFSADTTPPRIILQSPANSATSTGTLPMGQTFQYTVGDNNIGAGVNCSLYLQTPSAVDFAAIDNKTTTSATTLSYQYSASEYGIFSWYVTCTDAALNADTSPTRTFNFSAVPPDTSPPKITLQNPANGATSTGNLPMAQTIQYVVDDDNITGGVNCSLYLQTPSAVDFAAIDNRTTAVSRQLSYAYSASEYGIFSWYVTCTDPADNANTSATRTFNISALPPDGVPPAVALQNPVNGASLFGALPLQVNLQYSVNDNNITGGVNCSLFVRVPGSSNYSAADSQYATASGTLSLLYNASTQGSYYWYAECTDSAGNQNSSKTWQFTANPPDTAPPSIILVGPPNGTLEMVPTLPYAVALEYSVDDASFSKWVNCSIYAKAPSGSLNVAGQQNTNYSHSQSFSYSVNRYGNYSWYVNCTDAWGNANATGIWKFDIENVTQSVPQLSFSYATACPNNTLSVSVTSVGTSVQGVSVALLLGSAVAGAATTDSLGVARFTLAQNATYSINVSKANYQSPAQVSFGYSLCPPSGAWFECTANSNCSDTKNCVNGFCLDVVGSCGYASNHAWVAYACCGDSQCPSGKSCQNHTCVLLQQNTTNSTQNSSGNTTVNTSARELAQLAMEQALEDIKQADAAGKNTTAAATLYASASDAFNSGNYELALNRSNAASDGAKAAEPLSKGLCASTVLMALAGAGAVLVSRRRR